MVKEDNDLTRDEAKDALDCIAAMESAGYRRAVPRRWFGAGVAFFVAGLYALYALDDPYPYVIFPVIGLGMLIASARQTAGAYGRDFPGTRANRWAFVLVVAVMALLFFGSIFIRRAYDIAWLPIVVGVFVGLLVFLASENERRSYLAKAGGVQAK